ncbi:hypothetical protein [Haloferax sp. DFSO60]|uniref:hypothetical protein n=1 Tax=Haloferax sp. DFSO60 TaxID=3388652 RepID=UPI003978547F
MADVVSVLLLAVPLWLVVSAWVSLDASNRSSHNAFLWGLSVFVGGPLGLLLYFNIGRDRTYDTSPAETRHSRTGLIQCPNCQSLEKPTRRSCRVCDEPLQSS